MDDDRRELRRRLDRHHRRIRVGHRGAAEPPPAAARVLDADGCLVTPGLVNTHHHLFQNLTRRYPPMTDAPLFGWLTTLYPLWRRIDEEAVYVSAWVGLAELALSGCTTSTDHLYLHPRGGGDLLSAEIAAARELGMRFHPTRGSMSLSQKDGGLPPDDVVQDDDDDPRRVRSARSARHHDRARRGHGAHRAGAVLAVHGDAAADEQTAELAERLDVRLHTHLAENAEDDAYSLEPLRLPAGRVLRAASAGAPTARGSRTASYPNTDEIERLGAAGIGVAHCPSSNMILGVGHRPGRRAAGRRRARRTRCRRLVVGRLRVAVDGGPQGHAPGQAARRRRRGVGADALEMATRGGAACLGRAGEIGELSVGCRRRPGGVALDGPAFAGAVADPVEAWLRCGPDGRPPHRRGRPARGGRRCRGAPGPRRDAAPAPHDQRPDAAAGVGGARGRGGRADRVGSPSWAPM